MRNIQLAQVLALALSASNLPVRAFEPPESNGPVRDPAKNKPHQGKREMYQLTHNGQPVGKPHPHRITCYIEALERGLVVRCGWRCWIAGSRW